MIATWIWALPALLLPWILRRVVPSGWGSANPRNVLLLGVCAAPWLALATSAGLASGGSLAPGPFLAYLLAGAVWVELALLLRRRPKSETRGRRVELEPVPGDRAEEEGPLSPEAEKLLARALRLDSTAVEEIMTPREQVVGVEGGVAVGQVLEEMHRSGRTRIVAVEGSLDRILGIAHAKDLAPLVLEGGGAEPVRRHLRRLLRIPRRQSVRRLLEEFRRNRVTIGAIADVRGRTLGVVSLSDVFRFIVEENGEAGPSAGGRESDGGAT